MTRALKILLIAISSSTVTLASIVIPIAPAQAIIVFDPANYGQTLLVAARTLQQVNQQIQQIQNQIQMIERLDRNLRKLDFSRLADMTAKLAKIDTLMAQARAISFKVDQIKSQYAKLFPGQGALTGGVAGGVKAAQARLDAVMAGYQQTMAIQSQVIENVADDTAILKDLVDQSQKAGGAMQVAQATNQLLALTAKQQFQLQTVLATQGRSDALEAARRAQAQNDARAATKRFLGSGKAYPPR